jgi:hypothetical protein
VSVKTRIIVALDEVTCGVRGVGRRLLGKLTISITEMAVINEVHDGDKLIRVN